MAALVDTSQALDSTEVARERQALVVEAQQKLARQQMMRLELQERVRARFNTESWEKSLFWYAPGLDRRTASSTSASVSPFRCIRNFFFVARGAEATRGLFRKSTASFTISALEAVAAAVEATGADSVMVTGKGAEVCVNTELTGEAF